MRLTKFNINKLIIFVLFLIFSTNASAAKFVGKLRFVPIGCEKVEWCELAEDFGFIDKNKYGWQADKGDKTNGASIPKWAQKFVGVPFTKEYLPAAVLHDQYSKSVRPVRSWIDTQRMFHEVLLFTGVGKKRAAILYAGVLIGSGKWIIKMKGEPCHIGEICIKNAPDMILEREPEKYNTNAYHQTFNKVKKQIEAGKHFNRSKIEELIRKEFPGDIYLNNSIGIVKGRDDGLSFSRY